MPVYKIVPSAKKFGYRMATDATLPGTKKVCLAVSTSKIVSSTKKSILALFVLFPVILSVLAILDTKAISLITILS